MSVTSMYQLPLALCHQYLGSMVLVVGKALEIRQDLRQRRQVTPLAVRPVERGAGRDLLSIQRRETPTAISATPAPCNGPRTGQQIFERPQAAHVDGVLELAGVRPDTAWRPRERPSASPMLRASGSAIDELYCTQLNHDASQICGKRTGAFADGVVVVDVGVGGKDLIADARERIGPHEAGRVVVDVALAGDLEPGWRAALTNASTRRLQLGLLLVGRVRSQHALARTARSGRC